ncbi:MAG: ribbon-helix-helix protein, CopG family [Chthoniobacterales bacterium]
MPPGSLGWADLGIFEAILEQVRNDSRMMVCSDGMAVMTHRTTFALDAETIRRLKRLANRWRVSQAEVVRRAVAQAEARPQPESSDPVAMLRQMQETDPLDPQKAELYLAQVYKDRKRWRGR